MQCILRAKENRVYINTIIEGDKHCARKKTVLGGLYIQRKRGQRQ